MIQSERFTEAIADRRRVCSCICPAAHGARTGVCLGFMEPGQPVTLERINDKLDVARCPSCTAEITGRRAGGELRRIGRELRLVLVLLGDRHMARRADRLSVVPSASGGRFWDEPL